MKMVGKMQPTMGKSIFTGALAAASSARCRRSMRSWLRLDLEDLGDRHAKLLRLDDGTDEVADGLGVRAGRHVAKCLAAGAAHPDLGQGLAELVNQGPFHLLDHLGERRIEAQAGLHGDGKQVQGVRQLEDHLQGSGPDAPTEPELGAHVADAAPNQGKEEAAGHTTQRQAQL